jgi:ribosomal-protein-alanine N-acetyltransferase
MLGPIVRGELISLEPVSSADLPLFERWFADMEITRYLLNRVVPSSKQEEEWFDAAARAQDRVVWSIKREGVTIGNTALTGIDPIHRHAGSGLMIGERSAWGKGYASEAVRLRTAYAFEEMNIERLGSESFTQNAAMHRALEKSGYRKIGALRHYMFRAGAWHDLYLFELLREEWQQGVTT